MQKHQFYTYKFKSDRLKEFKYDISLTFEKALDFNEVIALFDNQILRSIRKIRNNQVDFNKLKDLQTEKNKIKKLESTAENSEKIKEIQSKIHEILFIPEYITIEMVHNSHYKHMYQNGLKINGKKYVRFNSSASQARTSTVVFVEEDIKDELTKTIDNGRNENVELVPSKLNAYRGLAGSSTQTVSTPRFCLVPDYFSETVVDVDFVTETEFNKDDIIEQRQITENFNRFDGQGIISVELAEKWANELNLDYIPSQWCIRHSFLKGMVTVFDIKKFCKLKNKGNYIIETSYKNEDGSRKTVDLRNIDLIITESQFKLWDSFPSLEAYQENCNKNDLKWGVSLYSPKKDKDILKMNYQFIQSLDLDKEDIEKVCSKFVKWIQGVSGKDIYYTLLFLIGTDTSTEKIQNYIDDDNTNWIKALILNPKLIRDKYIKKKIHDLLKNKIRKGCLGEIIVDGNFQTIVSDPYALMQHVCGQEVTGLLSKGEYYSGYWNKKNVKVVDSMRAPLTYRSEHVLLNLKQNADLDDWYQYNSTGIIVNVHGAETMNWAGSDFDMDIIATTSDETIIKGVYKNELPIVYSPPKSIKKIVTEDDLFESDLFSFGSAIGSITNKSTSGYALLNTFEKGSLEYETTLKRIKMCTKLQSAQIDKAKIGREVKGIPPTWINFQKINEKDENKEEKEFLNKVLLDRHPYFFIYLYSDTRKKYTKYTKSNNITCLQLFGMSIEELSKKPNKSDEELEFLELFYSRLPVIDSDCVMNNLCHYIESVDFGIRNVTKKDIDENSYKLLLCPDIMITTESQKYIEIKSIFKQHKNTMKQLNSLKAKQITKESKKEFKILIDNQNNKLKQKLTKVCSNVKELTNMLIYLFYVDEPIANKDVLWHLYGNQIVENIKTKINSYYIPVPDVNGHISYLNKKFTLVKVESNV